MKKPISIVLSFLITLLLLRELLIFLCGDYATSVIPGYSLSIYPNEWMLTITAIAILFISLLIMVSFKLIQKTIDKLICKLKRNDTPTRTGDS